MHLRYEHKDYNITLWDHLPPDLSFLQNNKTLCEQRYVDILFYIISAPHHFHERQQARITWAQTQTLESFNFSAVFFVGRASSEDIQQQLSEEFEKYGDVIQLDMVDSYENLTLKGVGALKWMTTYCSHVQYVIKADDDKVVDVKHFAEVIRTQIKPEDALHPKMLCMSLINSAVRRHETSKWFVPRNLLPGLKNYPPICLGSFYGYPGALLPMMHQTTMMTPVFWLEDVYFTGFVVPQLQLPHPLQVVNTRRAWTDTSQ
jgi:hypothetical protein